MEGHPQSTNKWAHVQFAQPEHAAAVQDILHGYTWAGGMLTAKAAGMHNPNQSNVMDAKLMLIWNTGKSTGVAFVQFATAQSANDAISHISDRPLNGHVLQVKAAPKLKVNKQAEIQLELDGEGRYTGKVVGNITGRAPALRFPVRISKLPLNADEILLREHFQGFGNIAVVNVDRKEVSNEDDGIVTGTLMSLIPKELGFQPQTTISLPAQKNRSGFMVHYDSVAQTKAAAAHFKEQAGNNPADYCHLDQPVRALPDFTYTVSFHRAIFDSRKQEYEEVQTWCTSHGVKCVVKDVPGVQPRKLFRLTCSDEDYLLDARRQLDRLLRCSVLKRDELFSQYGRARMMATEGEARQNGHNSVYLHWDNSTRQVRVYGSQADKDHLTQQLTALADELANLQQVEIEIPPRRKRECHQQLPQLSKDIKGIVFLQIMG